MVCVALDMLPEFAKEIASAIKPGFTIGLRGDLGAGKTTLVTEVVRALGYTGEVSSPTYVLEHRYDLPSGLCVSHWDLYRCKQLPEELWEPSSSDTIRLIEWPQLVEVEGLMDACIELAFVEAAEALRSIEFEGLLFDSLNP